MRHSRFCLQFFDFSESPDSLLIHLGRRWTDQTPGTTPLTPVERQHWASRAALSSLLTDESALLVRNHEYGFYSIRSKDTCLYTSFSHTQTLAAAAVSLGPIGIDLEPCSRDAAAVLTRICHKEELLFAGGDCCVDAHTISNALMIWTGKEAMAKASGLGMRYGLKNFELHPAKAPFSKGRIHRNGPIQLRRPSLEYFVYQGHLLAVCLESTESVE